MLTAIILSWEMVVESGDTLHKKHTGTMTHFRLLRHQYLVALDLPDRVQQDTNRKASLAAAFGLQSEGGLKVKANWKCLMILWFGHTFALIFKDLQFVLR